MLVPAPVAVVACEAAAVAADDAAGGGWSLKNPDELLPLLPALPGGAKRGTAALPGLLLLLPLPALPLRIMLAAAPLLLSPRFKLCCGQHTAREGCEPAWVKLHVHVNGC